MFFQFLYSFIATFCFSLIFNVKGKKLFLSSLGGAIGWCIYFSLNNKFDEASKIFLAALAVTIYSETISIFFNIVVTSILIPSLIPLVPGKGIYFTMISVVKKNPRDAFMIGMDTIGSAGAIAIAILTISSIVKIIKNYKKNYF